MVLYKENREEELDNYFAEICAGWASDGVKQLSSNYLYDEEGSRLCAAINQTEEYYIWRCEKQLLEKHADAMLAVMKQRGSNPNDKFNIVDLGAGDATKTKIILQQAIKNKYSF